MGAKTKKELDFYLKADYIMNRGDRKGGIKNEIVKLLFPDYVMEFLKALRISEYYKNLGGGISSSPLL